MDVGYLEPSHEQIADRLDSIAEIYDLYVMADYDIPFFLSETASVEGPVLELTAGTGGLSLPLIQAGVRLTCVDGSQGMPKAKFYSLTKAGRKRLAEEVENWERISGVMGRMLRLAERR